MGYDHDHGRGGGGGTRNLEHIWISFSRGLFSWARLVFGGVFFVHDNHRSCKMDHFETTHLPGLDFHVHDHIGGRIGLGNI